MRRLHNTNQKYIHRFLKNRFSDRAKHWREPYFKPHGVWYSVENDWLDWINSEMPHWIGKYQQRLQVDESKLLILKTIEDVQGFVAKYKIDLIPNSPVNMIGINWPKVMEDYGGIEIQNYHSIKWNEFRSLSSEIGTWFYGWDVSSGCIWDRSVIKKIQMGGNSRKVSKDAS